MGARPGSRSAFECLVRMAWQAISFVGTGIPRHRHRVLCCAGFDIAFVGAGHRQCEIPPGKAQTREVFTEVCNSAGIDLKMRSQQLIAHIDDLDNATHGHGNTFCLFLCRRATLTWSLFEGTQVVMGRNMRLSVASSSLLCSMCSKVKFCQNQLNCAVRSRTAAFCKLSCEASTSIGMTLSALLC